MCFSQQHLQIQGAGAKHVSNPECVCCTSFCLFHIYLILHIQGADGNQYMGAGDNMQVAAQGHPKYSSPLSFMKVVGGPHDMGCSGNTSNAVSDPKPVCANITLQGDPVPVRGSVTPPPSLALSCPRQCLD